MPVAYKQDSTTTLQQPATEIYKKAGIYIPTITYQRLREMAYLRRVSINRLISEYAERGLQADSDKIDADPTWLDRNF